MLTVGCRGQETSEFGPEGEEGTGAQWNDPVSRDWVWRTLALGIGNGGGKGRGLVFGETDNLGVHPQGFEVGGPLGGVPL